MRLDLADITVVDAFAAFEIEIRAGGVHPFPRLDVDGAQIGDAIVGVDRNAFTLPPLGVGIHVGLIRIVIMLFDGMVVIVVDLLPVDRRQHGFGGQQTKSDRRRALHELPPRNAPGAIAADPILHCILRHRFHPRSVTAPDDHIHHTPKAMLPMPAASCAPARNERKRLVSNTSGRLITAVRIIIPAAEPIPSMPT